MAVKQLKIPFAMVATDKIKSSSQKSCAINLKEGFCRDNHKCHFRISVLTHCNQLGLTL